MYLSGIDFERTEEERSNQLLAWNRDDKAFFAAGACHILAFTMKQLFPNRKLEIIYLKPTRHSHGSHVYVLDGEWAFDFNGWTKEKELLKETERSYRARYPNWKYERHIITDDLETFCKRYNHRPPAYFAFLPWERTYMYIEKFSAMPPIIKS